MSLDPENTIVMETTKGRVVIKLRPDLAPGHVERIKLLAREGWPAGDRPRALHYLVTSLTEGPRGIPDEERVRENVIAWLRDRAPLIWPNVSPEMLYHPNPDATVAEKLAFQFVKVHHNPSDRYVQSFPGSIDKRLPSKLPDIDNLALAGDWVRTGLSVGCVALPMWERFARRMPTPAGAEQLAPAIEAHSAS